MTPPSTPVACRRCEQPGERLTSAPYGGALGREIQEQVCRACWQLWLEEEVRTINELRLDFMNPRSQAILEEKLREFLKFEPAA